MEDFIFRNLGLIGTLIFVSAYLPQIGHLLKVKDSTGISVFSWSVWLVGALLLFAYAAHNRDLVFIILTAMEAISLLTVIVLAVKYRRDQ